MVGSDPFILARQPRNPKGGTSMQELLQVLHRTVSSSTHRRIWVFFGFKVNICLYIYMLISIILDRMFFQKSWLIDWKAVVFFSSQIFPSFFFHEKQKNLSTFQDKGFFLIPEEKRTASGDAASRELMHSTVLLGRTCSGMPKISWCLMLVDAGWCR